jgi:WhiB family redox-sensing transcriptional regulator
MTIINLTPPRTEIDDANLEVNWRQDALCAETDPEAFFPASGSSPAAAIKLCGLCEVSEQCLEYALRNKEPHGVWGGLTPSGRRKLRWQAA